MRRTAAFLAVIFVVSLFWGIMPVQAKQKETVDAKMSRKSVTADAFEKFSLRLKSTHEAETYWVSIRKHVGAADEYYYDARVDENRRKV